LVESRDFHEDFTRKAEEKLGSDRIFGLVFTSVFLIIALFPLIASGEPRAWALVIAALFGIPTTFFPQVLQPLNKLWAKCGLLLQMIINPIILGTIFFLTILPTGIIMRLMGKDPLKLRFDAAATSYWVERTPPGPNPKTMKNQF
jgi:hypothetical protein